MNRYKNQINVSNSSAYYKEILLQKKLPLIRHKNVYNFEQLKKNLAGVSNSSFLYIWKDTDKLYNVSNTFYQDPNYGWLILFCNQKSSEYELKEGTPLRIYVPLEELIKGV
jgi:hypothetical protein